MEFQEVRVGFSVEFASNEIPRLSILESRPPAQQEI